MVRPQGDQADLLQASFSKLLNTDNPGGFITSRLNRSLATRKLSYSKDVAPWLGEDAGLFLDNFKPNADGAVIVATTDGDAAEAAIAKAADADPQPEKDASYRGVDYKLSKAGSAAGIVNDFLVAGTERAFRSVVDTSQGAAPLSESPTYRSELGSAPEDPFATVFAGVPTVLRGLETSGQITDTQRAALVESLGGVAKAPVLVSATARSSQLAVNASIGALSRDIRLGGDETELLRDLPGDSWAAFSLGSVGTALTAVLNRLGPDARISVGALEDSLRLRTGVDISTNLLPWVGDVALFARGADPLNVGFGAVLQTRDTNASSAAIEGVRRVLRAQSTLGVASLALAEGGTGFSFTPQGAPDHVNVVQRGDRVVVAYGDDTTDQAFSADHPLGEAPTFKVAAEALGSDFPVAGYLAFAPLFGLIDSTSTATDPGYVSAKPYLQHLNYAIVGSRQAGDRDEVRAVLGLK